MVTFTPCFYETYIFPGWIQQVGFGIAGFAVALVPLLFLHEWLVVRGGKWSRQLFENQDWAPAHRREDTPFCEKISNTGIVNEAFSK